MASEQHRSSAAAHDALDKVKGGSTTAVSMSALCKRASVVPETALYKRPAVDGIAVSVAAAGVPATGSQAAAARESASALYGAYCADRHAASSAASDVANEMLQRLGHNAAAGTPGAQAAHEVAASAQGSQSAQAMVMSPATKVSLVTS